MLGCTSSVFVDFGDDFFVNDPSSEEIADVMIQNISVKEQTVLVKLIEGSKHQLQDGDTITFKEVKGMVLTSNPEVSINGS